MAANYGEARFIDAPIGALRTLLCSEAFARELNISLKSENPTPVGVWYRFHHGTTFTSWGEKITVELTEMGEKTKIDIFSECGMPTQIIDWGKNRKNVMNIFDRIQKMLPTVRRQPDGTAGGGGQHTGEARFCAQCGRPVGAADVFCGGCGTKIIR